MNVASLSFALFVLGIAFLRCLHRGETWRMAVGTLANIIFAYSFASDPLALAPLVGFLMIGYFAIEAARSHPSHRLLIAGLAAILGCYIYLKRFSFISPLPALPFAYTAVGLSYVLFRVVHLFIDASNGDLPERVRPLDYLNYCCNFLCFVSGPIQRFEDYLADRLNITAELDPETLSATMSRMVAGFFKVTAVSAVASYAFQHLSPPLLDSPGQMDPLMVDARFMTSVIAYCAYLYYNFSGYTDIVIGAGGLVGQRLPENFDSPFRARSFLEFWTRWHMTLSNWFKLYLFNPLVTVMVGWFPSRRAVPFIGVAAFFVTFLVMGIWHGTTGIFVIYGLLMGAGASINKLWQLALTRWLGTDRYRRLQQRALYAGLSRGLTYTYFSCGISCLWLSTDQLRALLSAMGFEGFVATVLLLTTGSTLVLRFIDGIVELSNRLLSPLSRELSSSLWASRWSLAAQILFVIGIASLFHKAPEFVYKAF